MARLMRAGTVIAFGAGLLLAAFAWSGVSHWSAVVLPFAAFLFGSALILPNATSVALSPFPAAAGAVSSLMGACSFTAAALISTLLGATFDGTARPMTTVAAVCGALALFFERRLAHGKA
jgi:DHA1 family bicyclomycin/chloramphenicol resistance-like MFS transporter